MFLILPPNVMNARSECFVTDALTVAGVKAGHNRSKRQSLTSDRLRITEYYELCDDPEGRYGSPFEENSS